MLAELGAKYHMVREVVITPRDYYMDASRLLEIVKLATPVSLEKKARQLFKLVGCKAACKAAPTPRIDLSHTRFVLAGFHLTMGGKASASFHHLQDIIANNTQLRVRGK